MLVHLAAAKLGIHDLSEDELLEMENTVKPLSMSFIPFHSFGTHMGESSQGMFMSESAVIRKIAINLVKADKTLKGSIKGRRKAAGWDNDYMQKIIGF